jgi:hypothetical protein
MDVCCVFSGTGLCDELITRPEESYRLWCVVVCDHENLVDEEVIASAGLQRQKKIIIFIYNLWFFLANNPLDQKMHPQYSGFNFQVLALPFIRATYQALLFFAKIPLTACLI